MRFIFSLVAFFCSSFVVAQTQPVRLSKATNFHAATAVVAVAEASDFTAVADVAGSLSGTYFYFYSSGDAKCYQPWYNVDSVGVAPTAVTSCTLVPIVIATGDAAATVAGNTRTTLNASPYTTYFAITGATTHVIVTSILKGAATDGNIGTSGFSVSKTQGVSGTAAVSSVASNVQGWRICADAVQTATWIAVGNTIDPESTGVHLGKGFCFVCKDCPGSLLSAIKVSSQAASGAYSVVQFSK